jgi:uncharacterized membrane protein YgdD (TMEM256/DUF423 family)
LVSASPEAATTSGQLARTFLILGCVCALVAVAAGAFGAHVLEARLGIDRIATWETAARYHLYHSFGLLVIGLLGLHMGDSRRLQWAGWAMFVGILLFSGSLYVLSLSGISYLGAVTPLGGVAFLLAWLLLVSALAKSS